MGVTEYSCGFVFIGVGEALLDEPLDLDLLRNLNFGNLSFGSLSGGPFGISCFWCRFKFYISLKETKFKS